MNASTLARIADGITLARNRAALDAARGASGRPAGALRAPRVPGLARRGGCASSAGRGRAVRLSLHEKAILGICGVLQVVLQDKYPKLAAIIRGLM